MYIATQKIISLKKLNCKMRSTSFFKKYPKLSLVFFNMILLLFIFIVSEIILRVFTPNWLKYTMNYLKTGNGFGYGTDANWKIEYKNGGFYSFTPNSTFKIYHTEYENTVHINSLGGRSTTVNEISDTNNIIPFIGDSFIMGVGVEDTENVVSITQKQTHNNFINLGIGGSCMPIQRKIINARYDELGRPLIVVYGFFLGNDFDDIINEYAKKTDSVFSANKAFENKASPTANGFMWKLNYFINHNSFFKKIYTLQFIKQKILNIKNKDRDKVKDRKDPVFSILNSSDTAYINLAKTLVNKEIEVLSKEPYKPIVIIIPDRNQIYYSIRKSMSTYYNLDEKNLRPFLPNQILIEALTKYKIKYIDPTQCLSNHTNEGKLYYTLDNHFTRLGQKMISECIVDSLQKIIRQFNLKLTK